MVRVDDHVGIWQLDLAVYRRWQMVIRHQHAETQRPRPGDAIKTGNAVVYRDQHIGAAGLDAFSNRRRQTITIDHAIWHDITHVSRAHQAQPANTHGAGGGTIAVVVGHDAELFVGGNRVGQ